MLSCVTRREMDASGVVVKIGEREIVCKLLCKFLIRSDFRRDVLHDNIVSGNGLFHLEIVVNFGFVNAIFYE